MAGTLKPNNVKKEGKWLVNGFKAHTATTINSLFDGQRGGWNSGKAFYWLTVGDYIEITLFQTSAIWALPNLDYLSYNAPLVVSKWDGSSFVSIGDTPPRPTTDTWSRMIKLDAGRYRFTLSSSYRLDDEWYIEEINDKILLSSNNKTYSLETINTAYETKMTSNTAPTPLVASASSSLSSSYLPYIAFNGVKNTDSYWCTTANSIANSWIDMNFGTQRAVNRIAITPMVASKLGYHPHHLQVRASNDNFTTFSILLDENKTWNTETDRILEFENDKEYQQYRLHILTNGGASWVGIREIEFYYVKETITQLPSTSGQNLIKYGMDSPVQTDGIFTSKNYILQDTVSENEQGLWTTQLNRKPLSIKFD